MSHQSQQLLRDALALPVNERADVAAELLASLDDERMTDPQQVEAAWGHGDRGTRSPRACWPVSR